MTSDISLVKSKHELSKITSFINPPCLVIPLCQFWAKQWKYSSMDALALEDIIKIDCEKLDKSRFQEVMNTYLIVCMYNKSSSHRQSVIC